MFQESDSSDFHDLEGSRSKIAVPGGMKSRSSLSRHIRPQQKKHTQHKRHLQLFFCYLLTFSLLSVFTFVLLFSHLYGASLYLCIFLHPCSLVFLQHGKFFFLQFFLFSGPSHGGGTPFRYTQQNSVFRFLEDFIRRQQHHSDIFSIIRFSVFLRILFGVSSSIAGSA